MAEVNKYSLWLMPSERLYDKLYSLIQQLSKPYSTPEFEPHVTLINGLTGDLETIILSSAKLASTVRRYDLVLDSIDHRNEFYRCLFAHIRHTDAVLNAHTRARDVFENTAKEKYMPHMSLMYGTLDTRIKKRIIQTIDIDLQGTFTAETIHLYSTTGLPHEWFRIAQFVLKE
jgi:2'-5' RNA ligase